MEIIAAVTSQLNMLCLNLIPLTQQLGYVSMTLVFPASSNNFLAYKFVSLSLHISRFFFVLFCFPLLLKFRLKQKENLRLKRFKIVTQYSVDA